MGRIIIETVRLLSLKASHEYGCRLTTASARSTFPPPPIWYVENTTLDTVRIIDSFQHRTVVKPGVDENLDEMKHTYDGLEDLLKKTSESIAETVPSEYGLDLNVIFFPQIGFLISMKIDPHSSRPSYEGGDTGNGGWDRIFSTTSRVYYKDYRMRELDETFGDIYAIICGEYIFHGCSFWFRCC